MNPERITKTAGVAYIRDTEITVWSIVEDFLANDSTPLDRVIAKFNPKLSREDAAYFVYCTGRSLEGDKVAVSIIKEIVKEQGYFFTLDDWDAAMLYFSHYPQEACKKETEIDW